MELTFHLWHKDCFMEEWQEARLERLARVRLPKKDPLKVFVLGLVPQVSSFPQERCGRWWYVSGSRAIWMPTGAMVITGSLRKFPGD